MSGAVPDKTREADFLTDAACADSALRLNHILVANVLFAMRIFVTQLAQRSQQTPFEIGR